MTVKQKLQAMKHTLSNARADKKIKIKDLSSIGIKFTWWDRTVYRKGGTNILTFMKVAEALGYELVLRKKEE